MATIEIDGKEIEVDSGKMVIEAADEAGIPIPRFCYHKKLSVAANCRMCLVEVEKSHKPLPACATPVTDGMKVYTKSEKARIAQKAVMEFLLINHPLDCPICDQGGECELQDVSMGYGQDVSQFTEGKRAVADDDLGTLISTEMTRCIHCTRCVRFGEEVAGVRELGATGRGEHTQIGTYVQHAMSSEVSGNIIDLCPVGALTSKPYRFTARPWELNQENSISPHDCLGSNLHVHLRRGDVMRVLPKEDESLNETWLSDRDRFSYTGLTADDRLTVPMVKEDGVWREVSWQQALEAAASGLKRIIDKHGTESVAALCSANSTTEEAFLLQKWMREIGVSNVDYRLRQSDFRQESARPIAPINQHPLEAIESSSHVLLVGSNIQRELPLVGLRVRKAQQAGAAVVAVNPVAYEFNFDVVDSQPVSPQHMPQALAAIAQTLLANTKLAKAESDFIHAFKTDAVDSESVKSMAASHDVAILVGGIAYNHPNRSELFSLVTLIERYTDAKVYWFTEGANAAGCAYAGMLPHRKACGEAVANEGLTADVALAQSLKAYLMLHAEPEFDVANPAQAREALLGAEFVLMMSSVKSQSMMDYADVILPVSMPYETSGTYVNCQNDWQSFKGLVAPQGEARPAWKVLRVLGNLFDVLGFEYQSSEDVMKELHVVYELAEQVHPEWHAVEVKAPASESLLRIGEWPLYRTDAMTRRSQPLQACAANDVPEVRMHPDTIAAHKLGDTVTISQATLEITLPLVSDKRVAEGGVWVANAWPETADLGGAFAPIKVK